MQHCHYGGRFHLVPIDSFGCIKKNDKESLICECVTVASIVDDTLNHTIDENYLETGLTEEELLEAKMAVEVSIRLFQLLCMLPFLPFP